MDINEKAKDYAEGRATAAIEQAIADAFIDGYKAGYKDRDNEIPLEIKKQVPEFIDLELPSGTLWAKDFLRDENGKILYLTFREAKKYKLPTPEQLKELSETCSHPTVRPFANQLKFLAANGNQLYIRCPGFYNVEGKIEDTLSFWLSSNVEENKALCSHYNHWTTHSCFYNTTSRFVGERLPIIVVK